MAVVTKLHIEPQRLVGTKHCSDGKGHMTNIAVTPFKVKTFKNLVQMLDLRSTLTFVTAGSIWFLVLCICLFMEFHSERQMLKATKIIQIMILG